MNADRGKAVVMLNGERRTLEGGTTLARLAADLGLEGRRGIAIAVNDAVVSRVEWPARLLADGDAVLVIRATQGG